MGRISKAITDKAIKSARKEIYLTLQDKGYMTREELGKKYGYHPQRIWRWITFKGLPYDSELRRVKEKDFLKWRKDNPHLGDKRFKI